MMSTKGVKGRDMGMAKKRDVQEKERVASTTSLPSLHLPATLLEQGDPGTAHRVVRGEPLVTASEGECKDRVEKSATIAWEK